MISKIVAIQSSQHAIMQLLELNLHRTCSEEEVAVPIAFGSWDRKQRRHNHSKCH